MLAHSPRSAAYVYGADENRSLGPRFILTLHATMNRSRIRVVVLQRMDTSEFLVVPREEFQSQWREA